MTPMFVGFDVLKAAVSMHQVLEHYGLLDRLHRNGDSLSGPCPLHGGHNPTQFRVSLEKNCFNCFSCQIGGSIVDFVSHKERVGIRDAAMLLQDWFKVQPKGNANGKPRVVAPSNNANTQEANVPLTFTLRDLDWAHPYLKQRGLSADTIRTFGIGYCRNGLLAGRIAIPVHNAKGQLVAYAGRWPGEPPNPEPRYKLPKGFRKSLELFNLHRATQADARLPLVVVEGYFGCCHVWQAGHRRVVSLMGSMLSKAQEDLIVRTAGPGGKVVLLFDEDEAGRKGRSEAFTRLDELLNVRVVSFAREGLQPDSVTPEQLLELIEQAASRDVATRHHTEEPCPA